MTAPFWQTKTLDEMTTEEWESLCDGCGRCCLHKLRDEDTEALAFTNVACRLLDTGSCRCSDYEHRFEKVPDCVQLTPATLREIDWLPPSCAYRRIEEGRGLAPWHPLRSGTQDSVVTSGASATGRIVSEREAGMLEHHVVDWPGRNPRKPTAR
ncbi:MAG: YcgN family cysteine cluster protein [Proteobacteria bacterium]|nr:YcgN family cysteine cluster protein [Pseudomonadota bacterium]